MLFGLEVTSLPMNIVRQVNRERACTYRHYYQRRIGFDIGSDESGFAEGKVSFTQRICCGPAYYLCQVADYAKFPRSAYPAQRGGYWQPEMEVGIISVLKEDRLP
jgi:hypothetical protein